MEPIYGMKEPYHYRNKAQFPVGRDKNGNIVIGFYAGRTHSIIDSDTCAIGAEVNDQILPIIRAFLTEYNISTYNETTGQGLVRHILTRVGFTTGEVMVCLIVNGKKLPHTDELISHLTKISGMTSICLNINTEKTNKILGPTCKTLWGSPYITDYIGNVKYRISPLSFYQVNPVQTKVLYEKALEYADLNGEETVWDMYCGIGTIGLTAADHAKQVVGVEVNREAVHDAIGNAKHNGVKNARFFAADATRWIGEAAAAGERADVIFMDPPREGSTPQFIESVARMAPKRVVYVSCNPVTLARDLELLTRKGYKVESSTPVDMFPHSEHIETVCALSKLDVYQKITVDLKMDELDVTAAETKASYEEIREYVKEHTGLNVSDLYIAQVKQKCGIKERQNYNKPKAENPKQLKCPPEKEKAIREALKYFKMI